MPKDSFYLLCDECGHTENYDEPMSRKHVGAPCPKCGADMLTEADYKIGRRVAFVLGIFEFFGLMRRGALDEKPGPGERKLRFHGRDGRLTITEPK